MLCVLNNPQRYSAECFAAGALMAVGFVLLTSFVKKYPLQGEKAIADKQS